MNVSPLPTGPIDPSQLPLDTLARNPHVSEEQKVGEATRQFEAMLLRQILTEARKTVIHSDLEESSSVSAIYNDMINQTLADSISRSGMLGLADLLNRQFTRTPAVSPTAASPTAPPLPEMPAVRPASLTTRPSHD